MEARQRFPEQRNYFPERREIRYKYWSQLHDLERRGYGQNGSAILFKLIERDLLASRPLRPIDHQDLHRAPFRLQLKPQRIQPFQRRVREVCIRLFRRRHVEVKRARYSRLIHNWQPQESAQLLWRIGHGGIRATTSPFRAPSWKVLTVMKGTRIVSFAGVIFSRLPFRTAGKLNPCTLNPAKRTKIRQSTAFPSVKLRFSMSSAPMIALSAQPHLSRCWFLFHSPPASRDYPTPII